VAAAGEVVELRIPARLEYLSTVRRLVEAALLPGWPAERVADVVLAVSEAAANAVEAQPDGGAEIEVRCRFGAGEVEVEVEDHGPGLDPHAVPGPVTAAVAITTGAAPTAPPPGAPTPAAAERGRGLALMRSLADDLTVHGSNGGTRLRLLLRR
jgi:anti-sigma regulatory factor (Ser/Thr protein kinase)